MLKVEKKMELDSTYIIFIKADEGDFVFTFCGNSDLYFSYFGDNLKKTDDHSFVLDKEDSFLYKCFDDLYNTILSLSSFDKKGDFLLLQDDVIKWYSDDSCYDDAAVLVVEKNSQSYKITIKEGVITDTRRRTASVRFRNNGNPYSEVFMNLYNQLCLHDFEEPQVVMNNAKVRKR